MIRKKGLIKRWIVSILVTIAITSLSFPNISLADKAVSQNNQEKLTIIQKVHPELNMELIISEIDDLAKSEGITRDGAIDLIYEQSKKQQTKKRTNENNVTASKPNEAPGPAKNRGDVMYSDAWTVINHGHNAIYYTTNVVVHAPGVGKKSKKDPASAKIGLKGGIEKQEVLTSTTNRVKAAEYAYNHLRDKPYDLVFFNNKKTIDKLNCSSLVWNAYMKTSNIDLDKDGGPGVYPVDIRDSPLTQTYERK